MSRNELTLHIIFMHSFSDFTEIYMYFIILRFIHTDDSDEKIVLFLVAANHGRER